MTEPSLLIFLKNNNKEKNSMTMDVIAEDERFAAMLLSRVGYYHLQEIRTLYTMVGSAQAVVAASDDIRQVLPDASPRLVQLLSHLSDHRQRVVDELAYVRRRV